MLDIIFIALWLVNRSKAKMALEAEDHVKAARYASRAKIFGWIEVGWLTLGVLLFVLIVSTSSS